MERERVDFPREYQFRPELRLCWRGLAISISEGFMTRAAGIELLRTLDEQNPLPPDQHDVGPDGNLAA